MKADKFVTAVLGMILALALALGGVGCLTTAFSLNLEDPGKVAAICVGTCLFCAGIFSWKHGWILGLLAAAAVMGYQWRLGVFAEAFWQLVYRISHVYNQAYHWGVLQLVDAPWNAGYADLPMTALGMGLGGAAVWAVCRGKGASLPVCLSLVPLLLCVVVTDTVPAANWLYLLILGQVMLTLTGGVRRENPYQGNRLTMLAALPVAAALALIFLAIPKEGYVNHGEKLREQAAAWFQNLPQQGTEILEAITERPAVPDSLNLATLGRRQDSQAEVMEVAAETGGTLYLRGQDYDIYDGTAWRTTETRVEEFGSAGVNLGYVVVETREELEELYVPYYPRDPLSLIGGKYDNLRIAKNYSFVRLGLPENWRELATSGELAVDSRYLELPENTRMEAQALLASILGEEGTVVDKAQAIAGYVRQAATYDKNTDPMRSGAGDFAMWFLREGETGYCVHFATASVVLLRAAGIPARYVSGYMLPARAGETQVVTGENAHAWAEYYVPGLDTWVILEATPSEGQPGITQETQQEQTSPETRADETEAPVSEVPSSQTQPPTLTVTQPLPTPTTAKQEETQKALPEWVGQTGRFFLLLMLAIGLTEGQVRLRMRLRRWDQHRGSPNRMALRRWREAERLGKLLQEPPPREIKNLALKAKFSQHTLTEEELETMEKWLIQTKAALREKPKYLWPLYRYVFAVI